MSELALVRISPSSPCHDPYLPRSAVVVERVPEGPRVATLRLRFTEETGASYAFSPGQFNMLHGPDGDVPISIVAGNSRGYFEHCVRGVGNASRALVSLSVGDHIGLRGPFGSGHWPLSQAEGRDLLVISGGIGCAAVASAVEQVLEARDRFGRLFLLQGISKDADHLYDERYRRWADHPETQVLIASMEAGPGWAGRRGLVTDLFDDLQGLRPERSLSLLCGPEVMVRPVARKLLDLGLSPDRIFVSLERNMQCGIGHCAHCQIGSHLVCRDGPVFPYSLMGPVLLSAP